MDRVTRSRVRNWLNDKEDTYWISKNKFEEAFPNVDLDMEGVTMKEEDGDSKVPKRDIRMAVADSRRRIK